MKLDKYLEKFTHGVTNKAEYLSSYGSVLPAVIYVSVLSLFILLAIGLLLATGSLVLIIILTLPLLWQGNRLASNTLRKLFGKPEKIIKPSKED